ncbi:carboxyl-terminal processing protease [Kordia periserrulae]|uniref:Carboxyl-terminal processing protease n=1 Tax=Kordia periserrulae TaxID=701523 RepID=A0A2T6BWQ8_9FLAO|nr:S41 family peptidase [Kordia periserrulae]PTX60510.1 carboxyl-terminal processing protease [Kordia periserrulae]
MKKLLKKRIIIPVLAIMILFGAVGFKSDFFEIAKQIEIFTTMFKQLNMNYVDETNPAELMDDAIKEMLNDLDPYTKFYNEQDVEAAKIRNAGEYSGIGASVRRNNNKITIIEPYKGYPADKAGLKAGDEIIKIDDIVVANFKEDTGELLKGAANSKINIVYKRQGKEYETELTRSKVEVDAVPFYKMIDDKTGYIVLAKFNKKASAQTKDALERLKEDGAERIVLDLRGNPGGLLRESIDIVNLFVPKGEVIVTTKSKVKKYNRTYKTRKQPVDTEIPLVVLVNGKSASASEIVSGALQDLDRAVVIGARSFGKGLVQQPKKLTYGTQLKVTISRYYTPSGRCIQALDYWNRDENGNAVRTSEKDYNAFKTKKGRTVYDGGGINPDIVIASQKTSDFTRALVGNLAVFDYATEYYNKNSFATMNDFSADAIDYEAFKESMEASSMDFYETNTERELKKIMSTKEATDFGNEVSKEYKELLKSIQQSKLDALDTYKEQIEVELQNEILKRYFYREGLYEYQLTHDEAIKKATEVLANKSEYNRILN